MKIKVNDRFLQIDPPGNRGIICTEVEITNIEIHLDENLVLISMQIWDWFDDGSGGTSVQCLDLYELGQLLEGFSPGEWNTLEN